MFSYFVVLVNVFAFGFGQNLGSKQYCSDLAPQSNLTMTKLTGTWFGAEIITHHDRVTGEKSTNDCVYVIITEIYQEVSVSNRLNLSQCLIKKIINKNYRWQH